MLCKLKRVASSNARCSEFLVSELCELSGLLEILLDLFEFLLCIKFIILQVKAMSFINFFN